MPPPIVQLPICHPHDIEGVALNLTNKLLSCKDILNDVVLHIHTTAVTQRRYTRSLALIVKLMVDDLFWRNSDLYVTVQDEIVDLAVATFTDYWLATLDCVPKEHRNPVEPSYVDPLAICAFIGDLSSLGLLSFGMFEMSALLLIFNMKTRLHLQCLRTLFSHAGAHATDEMSSFFLYECMDLVKARCKRHLRIFTVEEQQFRHVLNHIIYRDPREYFPQFWDKRLNVEEALMASVCVGVRPSTQSQAS
ncbi:hypothetical protein GALMADRAFT_210529 [Galerina marginata CBS 339.88]|uniref:Uncharacterized protein n=1 Tax=Galerina marginata (strain CBS 339.88) TaxID=685588 RepID=A0A067T075_GALM3|nr:hypothetical protein GALMADRAFT_210529 [Galerina marginata CBS 339.88]